MPRTVRLAALAAGILVASGALAQDEEELEVEFFFAPAETVSSVVKHDQPLQLSPSAVTVLTREDIEASGARNLPELLRVVPNLDTRLVKPMWYAVGLRGDTNIVSDNMLLIVDERDVTIEVFGSPFWSILPFSLDDVERVEVIRGPGSALYGANAFSGVIHVITKEPEEAPRLHASARAGEFGAGEVGASGAQSFGPFSVGVSAGMEREDLFTGRDQVAKDVVRGRLRGDYRFGPSDRLVLDLGGFTVNGPLYTNIGEARVHHGNYVYAQGALHWDTLDIHAAFSRFKIDADFGLVLEYGDIELARLSRTEATEDKLTLKANHGLEGYSNHLTYGADLTLVRYAADIMLDPSVWDQRLGLFLQDEVNLGELLGAWTGDEWPVTILTAGLRFDVSKLSLWALSPRASLVVEPLPAHTIRLGYAHAFQKPTFFESQMDVHLEDVSGIGFDHLDASNPDLENETVDSLELGYRGAFLRERLVVNLDMAYNRYRNTILFDYDLNTMTYIEIGPVRIPNLNGPGFEFLNNPEAVDGFSLEAQTAWRPTPASRVFISAAFRQEFDASGGAETQKRPVWQLTSGIDWTSWFGLSCSLRSFFTTSRRSVYRGPGGALEPNMEVILPAVWLLNARLAWRLRAAPGRVDIGLEMFNLLNHRIREYGGVAVHNRPDFASERLGRRIVLFLSAEL
jgi:iron complex outermembrane receptor protein